MTGPEVAGVQHAFHDVRGVRLHVAEAGDPDAPPILLLHGWPASWWCWHGLVAPLAAAHRLVMPDWRGSGWSEDAPDGVYTPEAFAADAVALLDVLRIPRALVIGHDWGCWVGFGLAARHSNRLTGLLAASSPHPWARPTPHALAGLWRSWYAGLNAAGVGLRRTARHVLGPLPDADVRVYLDRVRRPVTTGLYRSYFRQLSGMAAGSPPPVPGVPVIYLCGDRDPCFPDALIDQRLPGGREVEWVAGGHSLPDTHPELIADRASTLRAT